MAGKANPFDAFDDPAGGPAVTDTSPAPQSNAFDQFDPGAPAPGSAPSASLNSIAQNFEAAGNTDFAHMAGLPKDAIQGVTNAVGAGLDKIVPQSWRDAGNQAVKDYLPSWAQGLSAPTIPIPSSKDIQDLMTRAGIVNSQTTHPQNIPERIAAGAGHGAAAAMTLPLAGEAAAATLPADVASPFYTSAMPTATKVLQSATPVAAGDSIVSGLTAGARQAGMGAASGAGGAGAEEVAPDELKPLANMAGQIAGGGAFSLADAAANKAVDVLSNIAGGATRPYLNAPAAAGKVLNDASVNPGAVRARLAENADAEPLVPGSQPLTTEVASDTGLANLQRGVETKNVQPFRDRAGEQAAARVAAVESSAPAEAQPTAVGDLLKQRLADLDAQHEAAVTSAQGNLTQATAPLETARTPEQVGADIRSAVTEQAAPAMATQRHAEQAAATNLQQAQAVAPQPTMNTQGEYGAAVRQQLQDASNASKERLGAIWRAVDPSGTAALNVSETVNAAKQIAGDMPSTAKAMAGDEAGAFDAAAAMKPVSSFTELSGLRSRVSSAISALRAAPGNDQAVRRLMMLKGALDDNLTNEATRLGQADSDLAGRLTQTAGNFNESNVAANLQDEVATWRSNRATGSQPAASEASSVSSVPGARVSEGQPSGGPEGAAGTASVPEATPIDAELPGRYRTATQATVENKQRFGQGPVGQILAPGSQGAQYRIPDPTVMDRVLKGAPGDVENYRSLSAGLGQQNAQNVIRDYAAFDLRRSATNPDGSINPVKFRRWLTANQEGLSQVPGLHDQFASIGQAQQMVDDLGAARTQLEQSFPIRPGMTNADLFSRAWKPGTNGAEGVRQFMRETGSDATAAQSLEDGAAWSLRDAAMRPDGTLDANKVASWAKRYGSALSERPELAAKFSDLETAQRSVDAATAARADAVKDYQSGAAKFFLNGDDPVKAVASTIGKPQEFGKVVDMVKNDPEALAGLKRAVVQHIRANTQSNILAPNQEVGALKPDVFQNYLKANRTSLSKLFTPEEMTNLENVAADIQRSRSAAEAARLPGRSNTAQDIIAASKGGDSVLGQLIREGGAAAAGAATAGPVGAAAGSVAGRLWNGLRTVGIRRVDALVEQALLHPEVARTLLAKAPKGPTPYMAKRLAQQLTTISTLPAIDRSKNANSTQSK